MQAWAGWRVKLTPIAIKRKSFFLTLVPHGGNPKNPRLSIAPFSRLDTSSARSALRVGDESPLDQKWIQS